MDDLEVAAMLCSLMCHDLVSPVGAIANGVEILEEEDDKKIHSQALGLLSHSAEEASFRLQFFRLAFGASGGIGAEINLDEAKRVLEGFYLNGKINLNWDAPSQSLEKTVVKLLLNLVHVGGESLSRGGSLGVDVMMEGEGEVRETRISVQANGKNAALKENFKDLLTGGMRRWMI